MPSLQNYFKYHDATIRIAESDDIEQLVSIINEAYSYQDLAKGTSRTNPVHLMQRMSETQFYVVETNDEIVACVYLEPRGKSLHFGLLTVAQRFRGKKLAQAIINSIESYAKIEKFDVIELDYMSLAPWLKKYYEKYGYTETGESVTWGTIELFRMQKILNQIP